MAFAPSAFGARPASHTILGIVGVVAILYVGRDVFLPIAVAVLLTFALAPLANLFRRARIPRLLAVCASVVIACGAIGLFSVVVALQVSDLALNISKYQSNILGKVQEVRAAGASSGLVESISRVVERVGREIERSDESAENVLTPDPLPVEVISRTQPLEVLKSLLLPLISPIATAGLVIVVVIFMLLERENLRDRIIRLIGYHDLHRTTEALQEAGQRVGQYLLMQLVVNITYAIPITIGLWLLSIPNAILWGLLTLVLRFVPYIGPILGAALPLFLALAVSPGWSLVVWTAVLFIGMELLSNNVVEPWLYGSRTGLSPLAIIVAAIFWTWLWGPLGLVLSTPLTVCLSVLGRHVPQFEFLDVLFGNEPVLDQKTRLYQRLLAGDPDEATDLAEEVLEDGHIATFYSSVGIPALMLAEKDRARGVMSDAQRQLVASSALTLVANLEAVASSKPMRENAEPAHVAVGIDGAATSSKADDISRKLPKGQGQVILCIGGRGELDDAVSAMLAKVLEVQGTQAKCVSFAEIKPSNIRSLDLNGSEVLVLNFLNQESVRAASFIVRRLRRFAAHARIGVVLWSGDRPGNLPDTAAMGVDFVAFDTVGGIRGALGKHPD